MQAFDITFSLITNLEQLKPAQVAGFFVLKRSLLIVKYWLSVVYKPNQYRGFEFRHIELGECGVNINSWFESLECVVDVNVRS